MKRILFTRAAAFSFLLLAMVATFLAVPQTDASFWATTPEVKRTLHTPLGAVIDIEVGNQEDNGIAYRQLTGSIIQLERRLGIPYPASQVVMTAWPTTDFDHCGYAQRGFLWSSSVLEITLDRWCTRGDPEEAARIIAHEAAHMYFSSWGKLGETRAWIVEGLVENLAHQIVADVDPERQSAQRRSCTLYSTLQELEEATQDGAEGRRHQNCIYSMGGDFFQEMREAHDAAGLDYDQAVANLWLELEGRWNKTMSVEDVARHLGATPEVAALIQDRYGRPVILLGGYSAMDTQKTRVLGRITWVVAGLMGVAINAPDAWTPAMEATLEPASAYVVDYIGSLLAEPAKAAFSALTSPVITPLTAAGASLAELMTETMDSTWEATTNVASYILEAGQGYLTKQS